MNTNINRNLLNSSPLATSDTLDTPNGDVGVPLWKKDSDKEASLAAQNGVAKTGHLYRAYDEKVVLVTGQTAGDDFYWVLCWYTLFKVYKLKKESATTIYYKQHLQ